MEHRPTGEITDSRDVIQVFRASAAHLSAISVLVANYAQPRTGHLALSLYQLSAEQVHVSTSDVADTGPASLLTKLQKYIGKQRLQLADLTPVARCDESGEGIPGNTPLGSLI